MESGRGAALRLEVTRDLGDVAGLLLQVGGEVGRTAPSSRSDHTAHPPLYHTPSSLLTPLPHPQVALHWVDPVSQCRVVRVVSRRLGVVEGRAEFLRSVNPVAAAVLLGKRAVLEAKKTGAFRWGRAVGGRWGYCDACQAM